jgi:hypothetical protein
MAKQFPMKTAYESVLARSNRDPLSVADDSICCGQSYIKKTVHPKGFELETERADSCLEARVNSPKKISYLLGTRE